MGFHSKSKITVKRVLTPSSVKVADDFKAFHKVRPVPKIKHTPGTIPWTERGVLRNVYGGINGTS